MELLMDRPSCIVLTVGTASDGDPDIEEWTRLYRSGKGVAHSCVSYCALVAGSRAYETSGDKHYVNALHDVWEVMHRLQH